MQPPRRTRNDLCLVGDTNRVPGRSLADQIGGFLALTPVERYALERLVERERPLKRGVTLVRENDRSTELFALSSGSMMSYVLLDDGSRQILRFLFPGDLVGFAVLSYGAAQETLIALSDSVVSPIDRLQLAELVARHPRLALAIAGLQQAERVSLTDRLAGVARTSAKARIASVLLDIRDRLRRCGNDVDDSFALGLTQEEIGDATGLTAVHVNRMLRQLEEDKLIARAGGRVRLLDEQALKRAANHVDRMAGIDLSWLPEPSAQ